VHSIVWFFTTGAFESDWVQAVASIALVVLTFITLYFLRRYVLDTKTLAETSVKQMESTMKQLKVAEDMLTLSMQKQKEEREERADLSLRRRHFAYSAFLDIEVRLNAANEELTLRIFGHPDPALMRPPDWPDIAGSFYEEFRDAEEPAITLGLYLQRADHALAHYTRTDERDAKLKAQDDALAAIDTAKEEFGKLLAVLKANGM
jgi:hypothetical protein